MFKYVDESATAERPTDVGSDDQRQNLEVVAAREARCRRQTASGPVRSHRHCGQSGQFAVATPDTAPTPWRPVPLAWTVSLNDTGLIGIAPGKYLPL